MDRKQFQTSGILAEDICISQDTWRTQINNNVLVVGPSGAGKTRSYVKPNILQANTNMIVSDAKGTLYHETAPVLRANGYEVYKLDFVNMRLSPLATRTGLNSPASLSSFGLSFVPTRKLLS